MKKLIVIMCLGISLLIPSVSIAEQTIIDYTKNWCIIKTKNEFTDKIDYFLATKNTVKYNCPGICIFFVDNNNHVGLFISGKAIGMGITYRIDKNPFVILGYTHENNNPYLLNKIESNRLIKDFKKGKKVIYEIHSSNQFIENKTERVSLIGFTKLFDKVNKLANKGE